MQSIAHTPKPPYFAVIFTSILSDDDSGYAETADRMLESAAKQPGFLGVESARNELGMTVSYWRDLKSIQRWKKNLEHQQAQQLGRERWYASYKLRIARVEKDYGSDQHFVARP